MKVPSYIAKRYLFSKKSNNIINIISAISAIGVLVSTAALIIVISAFNGIEDLVESLYNSFDSDIRITAAEGKTFNVNDFPREDVESIKGVRYYTDVIEEVVIIKRDDRWVHGVMKGVDEDFLSIAQLENEDFRGDLQISQGEYNFALIGEMIRVRLGANVSGYGFQNLNIYAPSRRKASGHEDPFNNELIMLSGVFKINPDLENYVIVPKRFAGEILEYGNDITAVELGLEEGAEIETVKRNIQQLLGDKYEVKTRYEQNEIIYKTNKSEKRMTFLILFLILVISTFNIIASLTMLILDKKQDISVLLSMGASRKTIRRIFFLEGLYINIVGGGIGLFLGLLVCSLQLIFGLVPLQGSVVEAYPIKLQAMDFLFIGFTVLLVGTISSWLPVQYLVRKHVQ